MTVPARQDGGEPGDRAGVNVETVVVETADEIAVLVDIAATAPSRAVRLVVRPADTVPAFTVCNDVPVHGVPDGVVVSLGDLGADEHRRVMLVLEAPEAGEATVCEIEVASAAGPVAVVPVRDPR
jgi:hypothetical protein